jgi:limonene-1,2-epoxide hydrolase
MSELTPEEIVRSYWAGFGPTHADAVVSAKRWLHEDLELVAFLNKDDPISSLDEMLADLERARTDLGIAGYTVELRKVASNGNVVFAERHEVMLDADGKALTTFDVVGVHVIEDGRIRRFTDYFFDSAAMLAGWVGEQAE